MVNLKVVYFSYQIPVIREPIVIEQLSSLKSLDLYYIADIYMSVNTNDTELEKLKLLLKDHFAKIKLINISNSNQFEYPGIKTVYELSENNNDTFILYFHSKGMTSNQHLVRQKLFEHTIANYKIAIQEFIKNPELDVVSAIPATWGFGYYNFWWARSSYIYQYVQEPQNTPEFMKNWRFTWEMWLGNYNNYSLKKAILTFSPILKYWAVYNEVPAGQVMDFILHNNYDYSQYDPNNILFNINTNILIDQYEKYMAISPFNDNNILSIVYGIDKTQNFPVTSVVLHHCYSKNYLRIPGGTDLNKLLFIDHFPNIHKKLFISLANGNEIILEEGFQEDFLMALEF